MVAGMTDALFQPDALRFVHLGDLGDRLDRLAGRMLAGRDSLTLTAPERECLLEAAQLVCGAAAAAARLDGMDVDLICRLEELGASGQDAGADDADLQALIDVLDCESTEQVAEWLLAAGRVLERVALGSAVRPLDAAWLTRDLRPAAGRLAQLSRRARSCAAVQLG